ncbi:MAG TPA: Ldh family oxidoreductase [Verrucomicrobiota bacterium]|nr:Ldh family oxidoreductase [Verrucomicrobiota bacterium]
MRITADDLNGFATEALRQVGLSEADATLAADVLVTTDTWGVFTHGTKNLRGYVRRLRVGGLLAASQPHVIREGPAWAMVDGGSALAMRTSVFAMRAAMAKARSAGIGFAGVRNSCHFGAAGYYAKLAADEGMIGLAMANDIPSVTVPGAAGPVLGSNPLAYAIPHLPGRPILLDMATSTVAGGKVFAAAVCGQAIPSGWLTDENGQPTTDPNKLTRGGALTPMAGHKGTGLALLIETLAGVLTGAATTWQVVSWSLHDPSLPTGHGAMFIAIDIKAMLPGGEFQARLSRVAEEIRAAPKAQGVERILLPGDLEWERREQALAEGINLPGDAAESLLGLAADLGINPPILR